MKKASPNRITVSLFHRFLRFPSNETLRLVRSVLSGEGTSGWTIGVAFVADDRMKQMHADYMGRRRTTDVLSFDYGVAREGDIVVCLDQARRQAPSFGATYSEEVGRLVIHGVLHLLGYDDTRPRKRAIMRDKEDYYVEKAYARKNR